MPGTITKRSCRMMAKSFAKIRYAYSERPEMKVSPDYGIYINVPFCKSFCSFCPFYKEAYNKEHVSAYLEAICHEIGQSKLPSQPRWVYMGGGTPNVLSAHQLGRIVAALRQKATITEMGIELHPGWLDNAYLDELKQLGFTKLSLGVESLSAESNRATGRTNPEQTKLQELIGGILSRGFFLNIDTMAGLKGQSSGSFMEDIRYLAGLAPTQITTYPYMQVGREGQAGHKHEAGEYGLLKQAADILIQSGYRQSSPWNFTRHDEEYDSSKEELVSDYVGFGPGSFSTYNGHKSVSPPLGLYLLNMDEGKAMGLVSPKSSASDRWRLFAKMIADLRLHTSPAFGVGINTYARILMLAGFSRKGRLNPKGRAFAHHLTKTVVESLPFPLQRPGKISNYDEYEEALKKGRAYL